MTTMLFEQAPSRPSRTFWEPWVAGAIAAMLYLSVAWDEWSGLAALAIELIVAVTMRARIMPRVDEELDLLEQLKTHDLAPLDLDRLASSISDRVQGMFATASSTILAAGMAASAFLLLTYASSGAAIVFVAPKAFVATGFAIVCAISFSRDAHFAGEIIEPLRRNILRENKSVRHERVEAEAPKQAAPAYDNLISQLVAMQISHLEALNETNRLLATSATERVDEESGAVRMKLAKGLTEFRKNIEQLTTTVESLNTRIDGLADEEAGLLNHHRRELVSEVSRVPDQVIDRTASMIVSSIGNVEDRFRQTLQTIHDEENRRARDLLAGEFHALRDQFDQTERSVSAIATRFNDVVASLDALAAAFDRSAKSVAGTAGEFTREAEALASSVTEALAKLGNVDETNASLLTPLSEAATAVRKASSLVATDLRKVAAERDRLGRVRTKILELLPAGQGA